MISHDLFFDEEIYTFSLANPARRHVSQKYFIDERLPAFALVSICVQNVRIKA